MSEFLGEERGQLLGWQMVEEELGTFRGRGRAFSVFPSGRDGCEPARESRDFLIRSWGSEVSRSQTVRTAGVILSCPWFYDVYGHRGKPLGNSWICSH